MAELGAPPSVGCRLYSTFKKLTLTRIFSKLVSPPSPPVLPVVSPPPPPAVVDPHPIIQTVQKLELGKLMLPLASTATLGFLFSQKFDQAHQIIIVGSMAAILLIWIGFFIRESCLQLLGITLALFFLYGLVATFLSPGFAAACWILGALCLTPFVCVLVRPQAAAA